MSGSPPSPSLRPSLIATASARVRSPLGNASFVPSPRRRASYAALPTYDSPLLLQYDFPFDPAQLGLGGNEARRIFIGPRVEPTASRGREGRAGSVASRTDAIQDHAGAFQDYDEDEHKSKVLHRTMRQVSWREEVLPSKVGLKAWQGGSFEIGGDLRESARREKVASSIAPIPGRPRAQTTGGSAFMSGKRPDFGTRPRADTTTSFQSAVSHQEISFEDSRGRGEYFRPATPPPLVEAEHPQLLHSLLRKPSDLNSSTVSLALPAKPSPNHLTPEVYTPRKPKPTLRSASESYPAHLRPKYPPSPAKSILRSASESYPNNCRPPGLYQPLQPSKLGQPEVRREPSTHFGDDPAPPAREVLARTDEHLGMLTEEPESNEIPAFPVVKKSDVIRQERMLLRAEWTVREVRSVPR